MTKEQLIDMFERNNWYFNDNGMYRDKLLQLSYGELVDKLNHLKSQTAIVVFGGVSG
ncbi:conserved hypothetical protein [Lactococcus piscium]|nr:conserved hypothetical protein [Lactococcus piscium]